MGFDSPWPCLYYLFQWFYEIPHFVQRQHFVYWSAMNLHVFLLVWWNKEEKIAAVMELRCGTKLHHTEIPIKTSQNLWKLTLIEVEGISVDGAWCDESTDMKSNQKGYGLPTENMIFSSVLCIFAGSDVIRKKN